MPKHLDQKLVIESFTRTKSTSKTGKEFGVSYKTIWRILKSNGISASSKNIFNDFDKKFLILNYNKYVDSGQLDKLAKKMKRTRQFLCREAKKLGLTDKNRKKSEKRCLAASIKHKEWMKNNPHPKGFQGHKHSEKAKEIISQKSKMMWQNFTDEQRLAMSIRANQLGRVFGKDRKTTWKQAWHTIGGKRHYFRSSWEVNFAKYLQFLKENNQIKDWQFEPEVFWFSHIKRGVTSYLPDFKVFNNDGTIWFYEVKGWMDPKSKTKIKRFRKYFPKETLLVVDKKAYDDLKKKFGFLFE